MKLKHLLVIFCLIGAVFTQLSAQSFNRAYSWWDEVDWWVPVYCGDEFIEFVEGYGSVHFVVKVKNDEAIWERDNSHMSATGLTSGENFKYIEQDLLYYPTVFPVLYDAQVKYQLIGDQGHHYMGIVIMKLIYDGEDSEGNWIIHFEFTPIKNKCL